MSFVSQEDGERFVFFISFKMNGKSLLCSDPLESSEELLDGKLLIIKINFSINNPSRR